VRPVFLRNFLEIRIEAGRIIHPLFSTAFLHRLSNHDARPCSPYTIIPTLLAVLLVLIPNGSGSFLLGGVSPLVAAHFLTSTRRVGYHLPSAKLRAGLL
jgi:hypothetical protein